MRTVLVLTQSCTSVCLFDYNTIFPCPKCPVMYNYFLIYNLAGIFAGVIKRAISRALVLMVCLGWGVVRDSLGGKLKKIVIFLGLYVVTSSCRDIFTTLAITDPDLTTEEEGKVVDIVAVFTFVTATLDVLIYLWILDSINATIDHLEVRCLCFLFIIFVFLYLTFFILFRLCRNIKS